MAAKKKRRTASRPRSRRSGAWWPDKLFVMLTSLGCCCGLSLGTMLVVNSPQLRKALAKNDVVSVAASHDAIVLVQTALAASIVTWVISSPGIWKGRAWGFRARVALDMLALVGANAYVLLAKLPGTLQTSPSDLWAGSASALLPAVYCVLRLAGALGPRPT